MTFVKYYFHGLLVLWIVQCSNIQCKKGKRRPDNCYPDCCNKTKTDFDENGYNIRQIDFGDHRACCLCNKGTRMETPCNGTDIDSTVCVACEFVEDDPDQQYYMENGPHSKTKCNKAKLCSDGYIRIKGNRTFPAVCILSNKTVAPTPVVTTKRSGTHSSTDNTGTTGLIVGVILFIAFFVTVVAILIWCICCKSNNTSGEHNGYRSRRTRETASSNPRGSRTTDVSNEIEMALLDRRPSNDAPPDQALSSPQPPVNRRPSNDAPPDQALSSPQPQVSRRPSNDAPSCQAFLPLQPPVSDEESNCSINSTLRRDEQATEASRPVQPPDQVIVENLYLPDDSEEQRRNEQTSKASHPDQTNVDISDLSDDPSSKQRIRRETYTVSSQKDQPSTSKTFSTPAESEHISPETTDGCTSGKEKEEIASESKKYKEMMEDIFKELRDDISHEDIILLLFEFNMNDEAKDVQRDFLVQSTQIAKRNGWQGLLSLGRNRFNPTTLHQKLETIKRYDIAGIVQDSCNEKNYEIKLTSDS